MKDLYKTRDLAEATTLIVVGKKLVDTERTGAVVYFIYEDRKSCEKISHEYFFGEVMVNAREFHETMNRLKSRIFNNT